MRSKEYEKRLLSMARRQKIRPHIKIIFVDEQGRTLYDEDYPEKLFKALQKGDTISDFCKSERIPRKKFYQWLKRYPEFKEAFDKGREGVRVRLKITSRFSELKSNGSIVSWFHCCRNLAIEQLNNRTIKLGSYF